MKISYSKTALEKAYQSGKKMKYIFFWGHQKNKEGHITSACFSQWWSQEFFVDGERYPTAEHWMMAEKARLFGDQEALSEIQRASAPGKAKQIGRMVRNFDQQIWEQKRFDIVVRGNYFKFAQNPPMRSFLMSTKKRILVEASPVDRIWGIGLPKDHEFATIPPKWRGLNLLGFALMEVRDMLESESKSEKTKQY